MINEETLKFVAEAVDKTSRSMFNAIKYIYIVSDEDFYNQNVKDIMKIGLNDIMNPDCYANLGIPYDKSKLGELESEKFAEVVDIFRYTFAVRIPFMRNVMKKFPLKDSQIKQLYNIISEYGISNPESIVEYDLKGMMNLAKHKKEEPVFDGSWFRRWVYTYGRELSAINNRNLFTLGSTDAMFPLFYSALQDKITEILQE